MKYTNPILTGFHPDPSICRVGEDYYLVTSSFEYFPGVPIFHSKDLVHWRQIGHCLTRPSQLPLHKAPSSRGIYAPTLRYHDGTFYMVTTNVSGGGHFYVYSDDPAGEWSEPFWIDPGDVLRGDSIDPSLYFEGDKVYFSCTGPGQRVFQFEIDLKTGRPISEPQQLMLGHTGKYPEGPHLYKIGEHYYLMYAEGGTEYGHMESIVRGPTPFGPFEICPHNPILTHRSQDRPIQALGHADLVQAHDGSWWAVFLGIRPNGYPPCYHLGRETFLAPVQWTADGWPIVGLNGTVDLDMEAELPASHPWDSVPPIDHFDQPILGLQWNCLRNPTPGSWSLVERPGYLVLHGSAITLDEPDAPAFVGRRQEHFTCHVAALVDFIPQQDGAEAGLTVFMNERHHYEIAITQIDGIRQVIVRRRIGSLSAVVASVDVDDSPLTLSIDADRDNYRFAFATAVGEAHVLASGETRYLSTEVAGGFTGVYLAMYAVRGTAGFDWFEYQPVE